MLLILWLIVWLEFLPFTSSFTGMRHFLRRIRVPLRPTSNSRINPFSVLQQGVDNHTPSTAYHNEFLRGGCCFSSSSSSITSASDATTTDSQADRSDYENWVRKLYMTNMFNPVKLGLENIERLHSLLGNPMDSVRIKVILCG